MEPVNARIEAWGVGLTMVDKGDAITRQLRVLHLEDSSRDADLIRGKLEEEGFACDLVVVADRAGYEAAIEQGRFDLILSDYALPDYDGMSALKVAMARRPEVPFILISGTLGEEQAVESLKSGATDYILKSRLARLVPAVRRALGESDALVLRKQAEDKLRQSHELFRQITENVEDHIVVLNLQGTRIYSSPSYRRLLEDQRLLEGHDPFSEIHPEDLERIQRVFHETVTTGVGQRTEYRLLLMDGTVRFIESQGSVIRDREGKIDSVLVVSRDITERRMSEVALLESEARAQRAHAEAEALLSTISAILIGVDTGGNIRRWNSAAEIAFGIPAGLALGRHLGECGVQWNWTIVGQAIRNCLGTRQSIEVNDAPYVRADGKNGYLHLIITPSLSDNSDGLSFALLGVDTTQRHLLENQLRQAQKLESIGQLAAGIAHEINTPVQFIGDNLRFLQDSFNDVRKVLGPLPRLLEASKNEMARPDVVDEIQAAADAADLDYLAVEIPKALEQSLDGVTRVAKIVQAMKDFSHPDCDEKKLVDINKSIEATITVARNEWKYVADLVMNLSATLPPVSCLQGEFNQAILNLTVNAAHAIADTQKVKQGGKGTITVSTCRDGDWVEIRVGDTGIGIPEKARSKIFDPFFTTKPVGRGTGQGLFIAHTVIVEKHAGTLSFETEMGTGTTFIIRLPINSSAGRREAKAA